MKIREVLLISSSSLTKIPKAPVAILLAIAVCFVVLAVPPFPDNQLYVTENARKHARLDSIGTPKIVLVGGSNLAYGLDSEMLERTLKRPVANMGLHIGFGLRYMLSECIQRIGAGDLVIISPEYENFYGNYDGSMTLAELILWVPESAKYLSLTQLAALPLHFVELLRNKPCYWMLNCRALVRQYIKHESPKQHAGNPVFNDFGDEIGHLHRNHGDFSDSILSDRTELDNEAVSRLSEFQESVESKGARLVVSLPYIEACNYNQRRKQIETLNRALQIAGITVLRKPADSIFEPKAFYDTGYHLTGTYRAKRTEQLVSDIGNLAPCKLSSRIDKTH